MSKKLADIIDLPGRVSFSDCINLQWFEMQNRRRLCRGFLFAGVVLILLGIFWNPPFQGVRPVREEPYRTIVADIIEIPVLEYSEPFQLRPPAVTRRMIYRPGFAPARPSPWQSLQKSEASEKSAPSSMSARDKTVLGRQAAVIVGQFLDSLRLGNEGVFPGPDPLAVLRRDAGMDPGRFSSDIIYNPENPRATQGYVHIPLLRIEHFEQTEKYIHSLRGLTGGITRLTNIIAVLDNPRPPIRYHQSIRHFLQVKEITNERGVSVDSLFLFCPPLIYLITDRPVQLSEAERESMRQYLIGGNGVLVLESARPGHEELNRQLHSFLGHIFRNNPPAFPIPSLEPIPRNHPLYRCYFDLNNGPPEGAGQELGAVPHTVQPYLEGMWLNGRLVAVYSDFGYGLCWASEGNCDEQLKMGVNLVVYSLIQQRGKPGHQAVLSR